MEIGLIELAILLVFAGLPMLFVALIFWIGFRSEKNRIGHRIFGGPRRAHL